MLEDIGIWKIGEIVIGGLLAWGMFVIRVQDKKFEALDNKVQQVEARMYEMQTKFVTEEQLNSKLEPIQEDLREVKGDVKTLIASVGRIN